MWTYNQTPSSDELYHYGVLGMKWGKRKANVSEKRISRDFNKLKKISSKAQNSGEKYMRFKREHTYQIAGTNNTIVMENPKLRRKYNKYAKRADKVINKMMKKYGNVSVSANFDTKKGKSYLDIKLGNRKERVYEGTKVK